MKRANVTMKIFLFVLCIVWVFLYKVLSGKEWQVMDLLETITIGSLLGAIVLVIDYISIRLSLLFFNKLLLSAGLGYLVASMMDLYIEIISPFFPQASVDTIIYVKIAIYLSAFLLCFKMISKGAEQFYISLPFIRLTKEPDQRKKMLLDGLALQESKTVELASLGLFDKGLVVAEFLTTQLYHQLEYGDETSRKKAKQALDNLHKLEQMKDLCLTYCSIRPLHTQEIEKTFVELATNLKVDILTADPTRYDLIDHHAIKCVALPIVTSQIKISALAGDSLKVKIQRYGKEPRQGIGYLEDGSMVVVNGGGDFISETITTRVLSQKFSSTGRIIFCNLLEEEEEKQAFKQSIQMSSL